MGIIIIHVLLVYSTVKFYPSPQADISYVSDLCSGTGSSQCRLTQRGVEYTGNLSLTMSGTTCQRWDSHTPHAHVNVWAYRFPENNISKASNYCRNPSNDPRGPWCLTEDPCVYKEYCRVPHCSPCKREFHTLYSLDLLCIVS